MAKFISIIIPVFNSEATLGDCIGSIEAQSHVRRYAFERKGETYAVPFDYEIILIDDGSTDGSLALCQKLAARDSRIKVIHQENRGPSAARNAGLDVARGNYITFIDSDDIVAPDYLALLVEGIDEYQADVSVVSYKITTREKAKALSRKTPKNEMAPMSVFYKEKAIADLLYQRGLDSSPCMKLFRRKAIGDIRFDENIRVFEDLLFVYHVYKRCEWVARTELEKYYYIKTASGQMDSVAPMVNDAFEVMKRIRADIASSFNILKSSAMYKDGVNLPGAIDNRTISVSFNILKLLARSGQKSDEVETRCWENILALRRKNFFDKNVRLKNKIGIIISLFGKSFFKTFCKIT